MQRKKYNNPPLVEAVFEIFFSSSEWSPATPGLFYSEIKDKFPHISQNQGGFGISFDNKGIKIGSGNRYITQFKNQNKDTIIQLADNLLTVNKLPEYHGWEFYIEIINYATEALHKVLRIDQYNRLGLKTINKIEVNKHSYENFKKYFRILPSIPDDNVKENLNSFQLNFESPLIEQKEILAISLATLREEPKYKAPVMFQIYMTKTREIDKDFSSWLEHAHKKISETFENGLTKECKKNFDNVQ